MPLSPEFLAPSADGLVSRAHDIDRFLGLYRAELSRIPAEAGGAEAVLEEVNDLADLLRIVEELWETVSGRTVRLYEELQDGVLTAEVERELASHGEKRRRYLTFAAAAGIRVPTPAY